MKTCTNCLIIETRPTDWFAGTNSKIEFQAVNDGDWTPYLPIFDRQKIGFETDACVPFSAVQCIEMQINCFIRTGQLPQSTLEWLITQGYIETLADGTLQFHASERYIAKEDGTTLAQGTSFQGCWDAIRKFGILPWHDWPFDESVTSADQFYAPVPGNLVLKAKQFLTYFRVQYHWIRNNSETPALAPYLKQAPIMIGTVVCEPWDQVNVPTCSGQPAHSTTIYKIDTVRHLLDHYVPYLKQIQFDYPIPFAIQGVVSIIPPVPPAPVLPPNPSLPEEQTWLNQVLNWLKVVLQIFK